MTPNNSISIESVLDEQRVFPPSNEFASKSRISSFAEYLEMAPISVHEVASFYNMFSTSPKAKFKMVMCTNLPCALKNAKYALRCIENQIGAKVGSQSSDGLFSLHEGECFGACADAPVLLVNNDQMYSWMDEERIKDLVTKLKNFKEVGEKKDGST